MISHDKTKSGEYVLDKPPKKPGGEEVDNINTAAHITCDTSPEHEKRKNNYQYGGKCESAKHCANGKGNESGNDNIYYGTILALVSHTNVMISAQQQITYETSSDHENIVKTITNMKKNQVTTLAGKEDDTESTATKTTATFISSYELEWDEDMSDLMMEPTLSEDTYRPFYKGSHNGPTV